MLTEVEKNQINQIESRYGLREVLSALADSDTTCAEMFLHRLRSEGVYFVAECFLDACVKRKRECLESREAENADDLQRLETALRTALREEFK